ncbi:MAG: SpoIIE family protein phosphatase [Oleiphilaceae bacterium]|nr:SpoIIE family protein phosphatase [Oleiphilaceae bacterium]
MSRLADRILVIDANELDRQRLAEYLRGKGYFVHTVASVAEAKDVMGQLAPDLIFADVDNQQVAQFTSRTNEELPVSLVVVSQVDKAGDVVACLRAGAVDFILKPVIDYINVDHVIHRILDKIRLAKLNQQLHQELEEGNKKLREGIQELRSDQKAGLQVQMKMLPSPRKVIHGFRFDHLVKPSLYLSGDFLDYFNLDHERCLFYFADVSGHGASSAFITVLLKNLTMRLKRNLKRGSSDEVTCPARFLKRMNQELLASDLGKHVTVFAGILHQKTNELEYAIGGHLPLPVLTSKEGVEFLDGKGMAVGLFPDPQFEVYRRTLADDFKITVLSDGVLEILPGTTLKQKEKLLLDIVSREQRDIESLLSSLGLDDIDELPDDIAVLTVCRDKREP